MLIYFTCHISLLLGPTDRRPVLSTSCKPPSMLRQMIGRGLPLLNGKMMSRTRIRLSWQNALADKIRVLPTQLLFSSVQQMRSHSTEKPQGKAVKRKNENGLEHSSASSKDELHTHSHSILGHSHTHGEDGHGHDPEQILAALKGSGV